MIISFLIFLATIGFVWHRLYKTNMEIPPSAERVVPDGENWNFFDKVQIVIRPAPP